MRTCLRQGRLFAQPKDVRIKLNKDHELVRLTDVMDWDTLIEIAMDVREQKIKANVGVEPHLRELLGVLSLMAIRKVTYRQAQDLVAHYAPARYLCDLMDSDWGIDHITIHDFTQMMILSNYFSLKMWAGMTFNYPQVFQVQIRFVYWLVFPYLSK